MAREIEIQALSALAMYQEFIDERSEGTFNHALHRFRRAEIGEELSDVARLNATATSAEPFAKIASVVQGAIEWTDW
jgi:hypothetical protein